MHWHRPTRQRSNGRNCRVLGGYSLSPATATVPQGIRHREAGKPCAHNDSAPCINAATLGMRLLSATTIACSKVSAAERGCLERRRGSVSAQTASRRPVSAKRKPSLPSLRRSCARRIAITRQRSSDRHCRVGLLRHRVAARTRPWRLASCCAARRRQAGATRRPVSRGQERWWRTEMHGPAWSTSFARRAA